MATTPASVLFESLEDRRLFSFVVWDGGGGDHEWSNPLNWSGDALPSAADNVLIDAPGSIPIHVGQDVSIATLWSLDPLNITGGAFTVAGLWRQAGALSLSAGSVQGAGNLLLNADFDWSGGAIAGDHSAKIQVLPGRTVTIAGDVSLGRQLINNGSINWSSGNITTDGAQIQNLVGRTITVASPGSLTSAGAPTYFINRGTLIRDGDEGTATTIAVVFSNPGPIYFDPFIPAGTAEARSGTLRFTGTVAQKQGDVLGGGVWIVDSPATLLLPGPDIRDAYGATAITLRGPGGAFPQFENVQRVGQLALLDGRAFTFGHIGEGLYEGESNVYIDSPGVTTEIPSVVLRNFSVQRGVASAAAGLRAVTITVVNTASLEVGGAFSFQNILGLGTVRITGQATWRSGRLQGPGQLQIAPGATFSMLPGEFYYSSGHKVILRTIVNDGTIVWNDGAFPVGADNEVEFSGEIVNHAQFTINSPGFAMPRSLYGIAADQPGIITNAGTITIAAAGDFKLRGAYGGVRLNNVPADAAHSIAGGTVHLTHGRLLAYGGVSGGGSWTMDQGTSLVFGGLPAALTRASFDGAGRIRVGANLVLTDAQIAGTGDLVVPFLGRLGLLGASTSITRSSVVNDGLIALGLGSVARFQTVLTNTGVLALSTGELRLTGNLILTTTSVLRVRSAGSSAHGNLIVSGSASLAGTLDAVFTWSPPSSLIFQFLTAGSRSGVFDAVVTDGLPVYEVVHVHFAGATVAVTVA